MILTCGQEVSQRLCQPGVTEIDWQFQKKFSQHTDFCISLRFDQTHRAIWATHANGDYYDVNGVYIDHIFLDQRDITLWGFNQLATQNLVNRRDIPADYDQHVNQRCVTGDTDLTWSVAPGLGIHAHLLRVLNPESWQEYQFARRRLMRVLESHA